MSVTGFCTTQDMAEFLQIEIASAAEIAAAEAAIRMATAAIQNYCGQVLALVEDEAITLDSVAGLRLFLPELPVVSVAQVVEDGETLVVDDDYKLGQYGILYRVDAEWVAGIQIITVTYTHGHDPIPDDIVDICTRAALRRYQAGLRAAEMDGVPGVASKSLGDYAVSYGSEQSTGAGEAVLGASAAPVLLRSEKEVLNRYRYKPT